MNTLTNDPDAVRIIACHIIAERIRDAEDRRTVRATRGQRRAAARGPRPQDHPFRIRLMLRFPHSAH